MCAPRPKLLSIQVYVLWCPVKKFSIFPVWKFENERKNLPGVFQVEIINYYPSPLSRWRISFSYEQVKTSRFVSVKHGPQRRTTSVKKTLWEHFSFQRDVLVYRLMSDCVRHHRRRENKRKTMSSDRSLYYVSTNDFRGWLAIRVQRNASWSRWLIKVSGSVRRSSEAENARPTRKIVSKIQKLAETSPVVWFPFTARSRLTQQNVSRAT